MEWGVEGVCGREMLRIADRKFQKWGCFCVFLFMLCVRVVLHGFALQSIHDKVPSFPASQHINTDQVSRKVVRLGKKWLSTALEHTPFYVKAFLTQISLVLPPVDPRLFDGGVVVTPLRRRRSVVRRVCAFWR